MTQHYAYKIPGVYKVPAQTAGEELERIYDKNGRLEASEIVDESRPEEAALHPVFEWRDDVAAERWREHQADGLMRCIVTVKETKDGGTVNTRAFVHVERDYEPIHVVLKSPDKTELLRRNAMKELNAFAQKYQEISELKPMLEPVFAAIRQVERDMAEAAL